MLDPMLTLIVAKAKAVGLVAGTAMLTTALVGGGAVAMTAVSSETDADPSASQEAEPIELEAVEGVSDSPTVGIGDDEAPEVEEVEPEKSQVKVRPPLPGDFDCDESKNHGQNVSTFARSLEKGPGRGEQVSAVAQSDCGKKAKDESAGEEPVETESAETEVEDSAPKPDKPAKAAKDKPAGKPAKAEKKPGKK